MKHDKIYCEIIKSFIIETLIKHLKDIKKNKIEYFEIFFNPDKVLWSQNHFIKNIDTDDKILSIIFSNEHEFKDIHIEHTYFSVSLPNEKGNFSNIKIPYKSIVGYKNKHTFLKSEIDSEYQTPNLIQSHQLDDNFSENNIITLLCLKTFNSIKMNKNITSNDIIKITFFEQHSGVRLSPDIKKTGKLMVLTIHDDMWDIDVHQESVFLTSKFNKEHFLYIPYGAICTLVDNVNSIIFNREVKIIEEDFINLEDNFIEEDQNLVYVDFKGIMEDEEANIDDFDDSTATFLYKSMFSPVFHNHHQEKKNDLNNLIYVDFNKDPDKKK